MVTCSAGLATCSKHITRSILLLWLVIVVVGTPTFADPTLTVVLRHSVLAEGGMLQLKDIAEVFGTDTTQAARLEELPLGRAPASGLFYTVTKDQVASSCVTQGYDPQEIVITGAPEVRVSNPCDQLTAGTLNTLIEQYLKERLMPSGVEYQWELTREFRGKALPPGSTVGIIHRPDVRLRGPVMLQVGVYLYEKLEGKFSVRVDITIQETLWLAKATIPRGTLISRDHLEPQQLETSSMVVNPCTQLESIIGYRAKRTITGGRVITLDMIDIPYAVCRGDLVKITAYCDGVTATVNGQAKQNGRPGDWILVMNMLTKGKLKAQVVGDRSVVVQ